jgi:chemotaxis family two-component system response regulator Rcp1
LTVKAATAPEVVRILLIEDSAADVKLLRYALDAARFRYELCTLEDGAEALAFVRRKGRYTDATRKLQLIVMDLHLPKHDGIEVLREIRKSEEFADLPVAILSASVSPEERNTVEALRRTCFITKPLDLEGFLNVGKRIKQLALEGKKERARAAQ